MHIWNQVQSVLHGIFGSDFQLSGQLLLPVCSQRHFGVSPYPCAFAELRIRESIAHRRLKFLRSLCGQTVKIDQVELVHSYIQSRLVKRHFLANNALKTRKLAPVDLRILISGFYFSAAVVEA